jgi:3-dehydroquinate dehydratase-1
LLPQRPNLGPEKAASKRFFVAFVCFCFNLHGMTRPTALTRYATGTLTIGGEPRVVGTLSSLEISAVAGFAGDLVEVRLDKTSRPAGWLENCQIIEAAGMPVLLTARLRGEGGEWAEDDAPRLAIYQRAVRTLAAVDVELSSRICPTVAAEAAERKKICIVSYHDFQKTPPLSELCQVIEKGQGIGSIVKIATMIQQPGDVALLESLLQKTWAKPLCVIAMGERWSATRVSFARLGSCLTYGYLDKPTAPGQLSAAELVRQLRSK